MIEHIKSKLLPFRVNDNVLLIIQFQTTRKGTGKIGFILQFVRKYVFDSITVTIALILCNGQTDVDVQLDWAGYDEFGGANEIGRASCRERV